MTTLGADTPIRHAELGLGRVISDLGATVVVEFEAGGLQRVARSDLRVLARTEDAVNEGVLGESSAVTLRALAIAIRSVNDRWGVFSRSRIALLPHQLWVCSKVLARWPTRWLVADDVGLGKTIEAGLILTPLLASGRVRRFLILAPAGLVDQWQERLRTMFDIRASKYLPELDSGRSDFWNTHPHVVASAQTLRLDHRGRWKRLLESRPWDLVIVDEAHHLGVDETGQRTLAFELVEKMVEVELAASMVFFTGTPHRGKDRAFLSLLSLLRPDLFDPRAPVASQLAGLPEVMIRNNKQRVTDMAGRPLFRPVTVHRVTYTHSDAERAFYEKLTEFILTGKAYAGSMRTAHQRAIMLVLITMQKLASSSAAAVRRAMRGRLARLREAQSTDGHKSNRTAVDLWRELVSLSVDDDDAADRRTWLEDRIDELVGDVQLNPDEIPALEELVRSADEIQEESRIRSVLDVIESRLPNRSVLLFTEYKTTQALMVSALEARYGRGCVTFINGDDRLEGVRRPDGAIETMVMDRATAAESFNASEVQFLVSTEAAGEGIDLQDSCSALIHVDLPWNPMRMHQRVGRLNRYGQTKPVDVVILHNPETVEGRLWSILESKLERITFAFRGAMTDPEDMQQLVLGMVSSGNFERLFADSPAVPLESLEGWFDAQTRTLGGRDAVSTVQMLVGSAARFDFQEASSDIPKVDLPDLAPFFHGALRFRGRRPDEHEEGLGFVTPEEWKRHFTIRDRYHGLRFTRDKTIAMERVIGAGHRLFDIALDDADAIEASVAMVGGLQKTVIVWTVRDQLTEVDRAVRRVAYATVGEVGAWQLMVDWELIPLLNQTLPRSERRTTDAGSPPRTDLAAAVGDARAWLASLVDTLALPFRMPALRLEVVLWPGRRGDERGLSAPRSP